MAEDYSILDLNHDCLAHIFQFLTLPGRWIASQVCQFWNTTDVYDRSDVQIFDTSDPSWAQIFGPEDKLIDKVMIMESILRKYGKYIKTLKYGKEAVSKFVLFPDFIQLMKHVGERLQIVKISKEIQKEGLQVLAGCTEIIDFQYSYGVDEFPNEMKAIFQNNRHLKYVGMNLEMTGEHCLESLKGRSIEELTIRTGSQDVIEKLATVSANMNRLRSLTLFFDREMNIQGLIDSLRQHEYLGKLVLDFKSVVLQQHHQGDILLLNQLIELESRFQMLFKEEFFSQLLSQLRSLKSLNLSGCHGVTDEDLNLIVQLPALERLIIDELEVRGDGLMSLTHLKYLSCKGSYIFDRVLCNVIRSCEDLNFLDITTCSNITLATIDAAMAVTRVRTNNVLKIITDLELGYYKRIKASQLLELNYGRCFFGELNNHDFSNRIVGKSCYFLNEIVEFLGNIKVESTKLCEMNNACILNIVRFASITNRIRMKQVSRKWNESISKSWEDFHKLDFCTEEWEYLFIIKNQTEMDNILFKIIQMCGKNLKHIVWKWPLETELIMDGCPMLETIIVRGSGAHDFNLNNFQSYHKNLTTLSLLDKATNYNGLEKVLKINTKLKSVYLRNLQLFQYVYLSNFNPNTLHKLHLYEINLWSEFDEVRVYFCRAISRLINLRELKVTPGYVSADFVINSIGNCKDLKVLWIEQRAKEVSVNNAQALYNFVKLETLVLRNSRGLTDFFLQGLVDSLLSLSRIDITGGELVTDDGLKAISTLPNLQTLIIGGLTNVNGTGLSSLSGENFQHLECPLCHSMRSNPLCNVLKQCPNLMFLNIAQCPRLDEGIIDTAIEVTKQRKNGIMLKLISDSRLSRSKRFLTPPLLEILLHEKIEKDVFV